MPNIHTLSRHQHPELQNEPVEPVCGNPWRHVTKDGKGEITQGEKNKCNCAAVLRMPQGNSWTLATPPRQLLL